MNNLIPMTVAVGIVLGGVVASAQDSSAGPIRSDSITTVTYEIRNLGQVTVYLPTDMHAGDTISGTVIAIPSGKTDAEKNKNLDILKGYVVTTGATKANTNGIIKFVVPPVIGGAAMTLLDMNGKPLGTKPIPCNPLPPPAQPSDFLSPEIVQPGKTMSSFGPFDGDSANTVLNIGGKAAPVITESPRSAVALCPNDVALGPQELAVSDGQRSATGNCHVAQVTIEGQPAMIVGQNSPASVRIAGLQGYDGRVTLRIVNHTPRVVKMGDAEGNTLGNVALFEQPPFGPTEALRNAASITLMALSSGAYFLECELLSDKCGATKHVMFITGPSKKHDKDGYHVGWKEVCYLGTCHLRKGHAGDHKYSWKQCKDHKEVPHKETFKKKDERDARYREIEKERDKRKADNGFEG